MLSTELNLTVDVSADEWAYAQRRLTYLETLLVTFARDAYDIQEWFSAAELAALRLPGLPIERSALSRKARSSGWPIRRVGKYCLYHVTSLPARAFDDLIARLLDLPETELTRPTMADFAPAEMAVPDTTPPWVLPLMRLMRGTAKGDLGRAWRDLPSLLPRGTVLPTPDEAALILVDLGLDEKIANWSEH